MKVTLEIDGRPTEVMVDPAGGTVTVGGRSYPFRVLARSLLEVELEIAGERVKVGDWPSDQPSPSSPVTVEGERFRVRSQVEATAPGSAPPVGVPRSPEVPTQGPVAAAADAIVPPMPGKVIEVRVREGERVSAGAVLLVLEAMKMRNEIASPRAGVVRDLRVSPGSSVKGREPMLRVVADP